VQKIIRPLTVISLERASGFCKASAKIASFLAKTLAFSRVSTRYHLRSELAMARQDYKQKP
jgi:hypothetical protein